MADHELRERLGGARTTNLVSLCETSNKIAIVATRDEATSYGRRSVAGFKSIQVRSWSSPPDYLESNRRHFDHPSDRCCSIKLRAEVCHPRDMVGYWLIASEIFSTVFLARNTADEGGLRFA